MTLEAERPFERTVEQHCSRIIPLTRISHREGRIGPENLVKLFCNKHLADSERGSDANTVYLQSA